MKDQGEKINYNRVIKTSVEKRGILEKQAYAISANFLRIIESSLRCKRIMKQYVEDRRWAEKRAICWWEMN
jgi:hypothetical protein